MSVSNSNADALIASVQSAFDKVKVATTVGWLGSFVETSQQEATAADVDTLSGQIMVWKGQERQWAIAGQRPDGSPFSWDEWATEAQAIVDAINAYGPYFNDGSALQVVIDTAEATAGDAVDALEGGVKQLGKLGDLLLSPWVWWVAGGVTALLVFGPLIAPRVKVFIKAVKS